MATIVTRLSKGSPLTTTEMDANLNNLNTNKAELNSPAFTGTPFAPTPALNNNTFQIATTAFVLGQAATVLPLINGTATIGVGTTFARSDHVHPTDTTRAPLASPTFTGTVTIPSGASISGFAPLAAPAFTGIVLFDGAANDLQIAGATTGNPVTISAIGTDTDVSINLITKGTGVVKMNNVALVSSVAGKNGVVTLVKADVGLANVDNTSDASKPISTATQTALDLKAPLSSPTFTGTVSGITKTMIGLGNVDNTSDANKPISTATQTALDLKAPLASPVFTGTTTATLSVTTGNSRLATTGTPTDVGLDLYLKGAGALFVYNQAGTKPLFAAIANGASAINHVIMQPANSGTGATLGVQSFGSVDANVDLILGTVGTGAVVLADKIMRQAMIKDSGWTFFNSNTTNALDFTNGSNQRWAPAVGSQTLTITNWPPTGNLGELLIEGINLGASTITWPTINWIKSDGSTTTTFASNGVSLQASGTDWVFLWTRDGGTTIYGKVIR